jgi:hypothetical protein
VATSEQCEQQKQLREKVNGLLGKIDHINRGQMKALMEADDELLMTLDKELELTFGEKERAFGALFRHREEHGC